MDTYQKNHKDKLEFHECYQLLYQLAENEIIPYDPDDKSRLILYRQGSDISDGWYSQSLLDAAEELFHDYKSQQELWQAIEDKGFEPLFKPKCEIKARCRTKNHDKDLYIKE